MHNFLCTNFFCLIFILILNTRKQLITASEDHSTPLEFFSGLTQEVQLSCYEKRADESPPRLVYFDSLSIDPGDDLVVEYGRSLFQDKLFCEFQTKVRTWNCAEELQIDSMCVWESPVSVLSRASLSLPNEDECPLCKQGEGPDHVLCSWAIFDHGFYLSQYNPPAGRDYFIKIASWGENRDPEHENVDEFQFSIVNEIESVVRIACSMSSPVRLPARSAVAEATERTWTQKLNVFSDINLLSTWRCNFVVIATGAYRRGVIIWTPPEDLLDEGEIRDPDCIDCAWRLDENGIWLDIRGCNSDGPVWVKKYDWITDGGNDKGKTIAGPRILKRPRVLKPGVLHIG